MTDVLETRTLFSHDKLMVSAAMIADTAEDVRWEAGEWRYVGLVVSVLWNDVQIGAGSLWGVEHGPISKDVDADAWDLVPSIVDGAVVHMGSPLSTVVEEALQEASDWLESARRDSAGPLNAAFEWAATTVTP
jgi:hypothetical protein